MKDFHCRDLGYNCDFIAKGKDENEVISQAKRHGTDAHGVEWDADKVMNLTHEDASDQHRHSVARNS